MKYFLAVLLLFSVEHIINCSQSQLQATVHKLQSRLLDENFWNTNAMVLTLNEFLYCPLKAGEQYFFIDLTKDDNDPKLTLEYLPKSVQVTILFTDSKSSSKPNGTDFSSYDSDGKDSWEIAIGTKNIDLSAQNRLFITVNAKADPGPNQNFKIKVSTESSPTLTIILIVVGTISIILNIIGCVYFVKYKLRREVQAALRQQLERENLYASLPGNGATSRSRARVDIDQDAALTLEDLNLYFPENNFEGLKSSFSQGECYICLEEFKPETVCRQLYCQHIYHTKCIQSWLASQKACPTCKKNMTRRAIAEYFTMMKKLEVQVLVDKKETVEEEKEEVPENHEEVPEKKEEEVAIANKEEREIRS